MCTCLQKSLSLRSGKRASLRSENERPGPPPSARIGGSVKSGVGRDVRCQNPRGVRDAQDCAAEAIETDGCCPNKGKMRSGVMRVNTDAPYAELREILGIHYSWYLGTIFGEKNNSREWYSREGRCISPCANGPGLYIAPPLSSIGTS